MNENRKCPHCSGDLSRYEDPLAKAMLAKQDDQIRPLKIGVSDVIHRRITYTGDIPEALDVELGFVNGGPDNLRCANIGGDWYIHANDIGQLLGIIPRADRPCSECGGAGWIASSDRFGTQIQKQCEHCVGIANEEKGSKP